MIPSEGGLESRPDARPIVLMNAGGVVDCGVRTVCLVKTSELIHLPGPSFSASDKIAFPQRAMRRALCERELLLRGLRRSDRFSAIRDVDERQHDAVQSIVAGAVREHAHRKPRLALSLDFTFDNLEAVERLEADASDTFKWPSTTDRLLFGAIT